MSKNNRFKSTLFSGVAAMGLLALPGSLLAGTDVVTKEVKPVEATKTSSSVTGDAGVNFVSTYFSRGILQENQGVIAQPYADLFFSLYEGSGFINKVSLNLGVWASVHSFHPGNASTVPAWYEFDWMPGVAVTFAKNFTLTTSYYELDSPNGAFITSRSINVNLAYNDTDLLGKFAVHPHFTYLRELEGKAGLGTKLGNYFEVGIAPALPAFGPVTVSFPTTAGFGSDGFYAGTGFGYFSVGPNVAVSLPFVPAR